MSGSKIQLLKFKLSVLFSILCLPVLLFSQEIDTVKKDKTLAIYPAFGYSPETSAQLGAIAIWVLPNKDSSQSEYVRQSSINPFVLFSLRRQLQSAVNFDLFLKNGMNVNLSPRFNLFPDNYYGIGNDNDPEELENYTNQFLRIDGFVLKPLNPRTFVGVSFDIQNNTIREIKPAGMLETDSPVGISGGTNGVIGPAFRFDSRNDILYPSSGQLISLTSFFTIFGNFSYSAYEFDYRKYWAINDSKNILAFNLNTRLTVGDDIPFYKLPQLGGDERLRGIANASLYRDKQSWYGQIEYRRHLVWRHGMAVFTGFGDVAPTLGDFQLNQTKYVAGLGYRFAAVEGQNLNVRFDFGIARGRQTGFYVSVREAF